MNNHYIVYILASKRNGTLYVGVTNDLSRRYTQHLNKEGSEFVKKYSIHRLIYYEYFSDVNQALYREKQLKNWRRKWKISLIEKHNPEWEDLSKYI